MKLFHNYLNILRGLFGEKNFDSVVTKSELRLLYAPWRTVANKIKEKQNNILAVPRLQQAPIDAVVTRFAIQGYPALGYFSNGQFQRCHDKQMVSFTKTWSKHPLPLAKQLRLKQTTPVRQIDTSSFRHALWKLKHALSMLYASWCGYCKTKPEFSLAVEQFIDKLGTFRTLQFTNAPLLCNSFKTAEYPTMNYFSYIDKFFKYYGAKKEVDLASFIHTQMIHATNQATKAATTPQEAGFGSNVQLSFDADFEQKIADSDPTFVMFYASWCSHCVAVKPVYSRLATKVKEGNIRLKVIAVDAAENPKVADIAGIETLPTFKIFKNGKEIALYEGDRSMENMLKFCETYMK